MNASSKQIWHPTTFLRFSGPLDTNTQTARIITDAGPAYIKVLGNRQGPHALACELVGTYLAQWLGLPTLEFDIMGIDEQKDEIPLTRGYRGKTGPAFITKETKGISWGGSVKELRKLINKESISHLVVFDTWTRNCDRCPPENTQRKVNFDNVFIEEIGQKGNKKYRLLAIDHSCCFNWGRDLTPGISAIELVKDERIYGLFPAFKKLIRQDEIEIAITQLGKLTEDIVEKFVNEVPTEWQVNQQIRIAWRELILRRANYVADTILERIKKICWPGMLFDKN